MNVPNGKAGAGRTAEELAVFLERHTFSRTFTGGTTIHFRPIRPNDARRLQEFFCSHSEETVVHRYLAHVSFLSAEQIRKFVNVDYWNEFALAGLLRSQRCERIICIGRFSRNATGDEAELAIVVHDDFRGRGIGTFLVKRLMETATELGIGVLTASVFMDNHVMMHIFKKMAPVMEERLDSGIYEVRLRAH